MEKRRTKVKVTVGVVWLILCSLVFAGSGLAQEKTKEAAVVKYEKYEYGAKRQGYTKSLVNCIKEAGYEPDLVSVDIFLKKNKEECASYKRILMPAMASRFTSEMYEGMREYVKNGGLLIVNESPGSMGDYKGDKGATKPFGRKGFDIIGTYGHTSVYIIKMKVLSLTPITEGLTLDEWITLDPRGAGRMTMIKGGGATELVTSMVLYNDKPYKDQPLLTYKRTGDGACIYIVPKIYEKMDKNLKTIFRNVLNEKTLNWLTAGDVL